MTSQRGSSACFFIGQPQSCVKILLKQDCAVSAYPDRVYLAGSFRVGCPE
jgi:hypothetical protein